MENLQELDDCLKNITSPDISVKIRQLAFDSLDNVILKQSQSNVLKDFQIEQISQRLTEFSGHHDPRIRFSALNSLLNLCEHTTFLLPKQNFAHYCAFLKDSNENVRIAAMKILIKLADKLVEIDLDEHTENDDLFEQPEYTEFPVCVGQPVPESALKHRNVVLLNDAFAKISSMMLDSSRTVRIEACRSLGSFPYVSDQLLIKSVDKMLMSDMKRKRTAQDRQRDAYYEGTWDSNKKWTDDAPLEEMKDVDWNELTSCGVFIYALEDEFSDVRFEALEGMAKLAEKCSSKTFCEKALGQIIEVFADEIFEVRLKAAESARRIIHKVLLRQDLIDVTLNSIDDELPEMREQLYGMLSKCRMLSKNGVRSTMDKLLHNIVKYSQDKYLIWTVCKNLGRNNCNLVSLYTPELIGLHPYVRRQDQDIKNKEYICKLILIFNAAKYCLTITNFLETPLDQHYSCLLDSYPELIPPLDVFLRKTSMIEASPVNPKELLNQVFGRLKLLGNSTVEQRISLLTATVNDLNKLAQLHPDLEASGYFFAAYIQCHLLLTRILEDNNWINSFLLSPAQSGVFRSSLQHILCSTFTLMNAFTGLSGLLNVNIQKLRVKTMAIQLIAIIHGSNASAMVPFEAFMNEMQHLQQLYARIAYQENDSLLCDIERVLKGIVDPRPGKVGRALQPLFLNIPKAESFCLLTPVSETQLFEDIQNIKMATGRILKPSSRSDSIHCFTAGLAHSLKFVAIVKNIPDLKVLRIRVQYPNQQTQVIQPKETDFHRSDDTPEIKLRSNIFISTFDAWADEAPIEFSLILDLRDLTQTYMTNTNVFNSFLSKSSGIRSTKSGDNLIIELGRPVRVLFQALKAKFT